MAGNFKGDVIHFTFYLLFFFKGNKKSHKCKQCIIVYFRNDIESKLGFAKKMGINPLQYTMNMAMSGPCIFYIPLNFDEYFATNTQP